MSKPVASSTPLVDSLTGARTKPRLTRKAGGCLVAKPMCYCHSCEVAPREVGVAKHAVDLELVLCKKGHTFVT